MILYILTRREHEDDIYVKDQGTLQKITHYLISENMTNKNRVLS